MYVGPGRPLARNIILPVLNILKHFSKKQASGFHGNCSCVIHRKSIGPIIAVICMTAVIGPIDFFTGNAG